MTKTAKRFDDLPQTLFSMDSTAQQATAQQAVDQACLELFGCEVKTKKTLPFPKVIDPALKASWDKHVKTWKPINSDMGCKQSALAALSVFYAWSSVNANLHETPEGALGSTMELLTRSLACGLSVKLNLALQQTSIPQQCKVSDHRFQVSSTSLFPSLLRLCVHPTLSGVVVYKAHKKSKRTGLLLSDLENPSFLNDTGLWTPCKKEKHLEVFYIALCNGRPNSKLFIAFKYRVMLDVVLFNPKWSTQQTQNMLVSLWKQCFSPP